MSEFRCGRYVSARIHHLLGNDPSNLSPSARAVLAQLRQAAAQEPGTAAGVWPFTVEGIPDDLLAEQYQRAEQAIHIALTHFAVHQQARGTSMHDGRQPFGRAVRRLADSQKGDGEPHETPVYQRFAAMAQTTTLPGLLAHARSIITQLRAQEIPFDYGRFADDLYWFQTPGGARDVQRRWGRDFHRLTTTESTTQNEGEA